VTAPSKRARLLGGLLPESIKWQLFLARQQTNPRYLQDGDTIVASASTDDGAIDLGRQRTVVRWTR
jgi:hypothetical protein